jgi:hypothetical protein
MAKKKFPMPKDVSDDNPVAWRSREDMISIVNAATGASHAKFSESVQTWVRKRGKDIGWHRVYFPLAYPSKTLRAGAVFVKKKQPKPEA